MDYETIKYVVIFGGFFLLYRTYIDSEEIKTLKSEMQDLKSRIKSTESDIEYICKQSNIESEFEKKTPYYLK